MEKTINTKLELQENEQDDLDSESENDIEPEEPEEVTELLSQLPNPEFFSFADGKGKILTLGSRLFNVNQLCAMSFQFLGLPIPTSTKATPSYT